MCIILSPFSSRAVSPHTFETLVSFFLYVRLDGPPPLWIRNAVANVSVERIHLLSCLVVLIILLISLLKRLGSVPSHLT